MPYEPLVTVVTSSWQRPRTVVEHAVASINRQTYPNIQHLVVIDGNDPATELSLWEAGYTSEATASRRFVALGRNWSALAGTTGYGATARLTGSLLAAGDLIAYLDDDNDYLSTHVAEMVALFENPDIGFALSAWTGRPGDPAPAVGSADTSGIMHRPRLVMRYGGFDPRDGYEGDGQMVTRWAAAGVQWAAKSSPTFSINGYHHGAPLG